MKIPDMTNQIHHGTSFQGVGECDCESSSYVRAKNWGLEAALCVYQRADHIIQTIDSEQGDPGSFPRDE